MGFFDRWFPGAGHGVDELARRLGMNAEALRRAVPRYREFTIAKRDGGRRRILAPQPELKSLQRRILRRVLGRLKSHPAAMGFERGRSIVTNALAHQGQAVVARMDVKDFFGTTRTSRVQRYFRLIGWNRPAARLLTRLCTHEGGLPQGAPTSPRLSNLVNYPLDARISAVAARLGGVYTRYADDVTISFDRDVAMATNEQQSPRSGVVSSWESVPASGRLHFVQRFVREAFEEAGYRLHRRKKTSVRRQHHRQSVCGLVVNARVNLPRETRRWLRAVEHRARLADEARAAPLGSLEYHRRKEPTLTENQLAGWRAFCAMVQRQVEAYRVADG